VSPALASLDLEARDAQRVRVERRGEHALHEPHAVLRELQREPAAVEAPGDER
jgi:hypothetical protein